MSDQSDNLAELAADQRSPDEDSEASRRPLLPESVSIPLPESDRRDLQNEPIISEQADAGPSQPTRIELDSHVLKLKGLPYSATTEAIKEFFSDFSVVNISFVFEPDGRPSGLGFAEFTSKEEALKALVKNGEFIGDRYVRLLHVPVEEMEEQVRLGTSAVPGNYKRMQGQQSRNQQPIDVLGQRGYRPTGMPSMGPHGPLMLSPHHLMLMPGAYANQSILTQNHHGLPRWSGAHVDMSQWQSYASQGQMSPHSLAAQIQSMSIVSSREAGPHIQPSHHPLMQPNYSNSDGPIAMPNQPRSSAQPPSAIGSLPNLPSPSDSYQQHLYSFEDHQQQQSQAFSSFDLTHSGAAMHQNMGTVSATVKVRDLPYRSTPADILSFFIGYQYLPDSLQIGLDSLGRPSGEAWLTFVNPSEASRAVRDLNRQFLGNRYLELCIC